MSAAGRSSGVVVMRFPGADADASGPRPVPALQSLARRPHGNSVAPCRLERHSATEIREPLGIAGCALRWPGPGRPITRAHNAGPSGHSRRTERHHVGAGERPLGPQCGARGIGPRPPIPIESWAVVPVAGGSRWYWRVKPVEPLLRPSSRHATPKTSMATAMRPTSFDIATIPVRRYLPVAAGPPRPRGPIAG